MKIDLIKLTFDGDISYKIKQFNYCCEKVKYNPMIGLTHTDIEQFWACSDCENNCSSCEYDSDSDYNKCPKVKALPEEQTEDNGLYIGVTMKETKHYYDCDDNDYSEVDYYYPIHYCPYCGEKIEVVVSEEIDVTEIYNNLNKQRDTLWERCRKTDSIKEESELKKQVRFLDEQINDFFKISTYEKEKYQNTKGKKINNEI